MDKVEFPPAIWSFFFSALITILIWLFGDAASAFQLIDNAVAWGTYAASIMLTIARLWQEYKRNRVHTMTRGAAGKPLWRRWLLG